MQLKEETLNKVEKYINVIGELITVVATHIYATYQETTQIKSYAVQKKLAERMNCPEKNTQPLSLFALTQRIHDRYKIVKQFNKDIKPPTIPIPPSKDALNTVLNDLLNSELERGESHLDYTEESRKITIVFRDLLNGKYDDYSLIEMCNGQYSLIKLQNESSRNQYEHTINDLFIYLGLGGSYQEDPDFEIAKFHFIQSIIRNLNFVLKYLIYFIMHHYQSAVSIISIINGVAKGFINPSDLGQNINGGLTTRERNSVGLASATDTQAHAQVTANAAELTKEQIQCGQINNKFEDITTNYDLMMKNFPAFNPFALTSDESTSQAHRAAKEAQQKEIPDLLNAWLTEVSAWHDRFNKIWSMCFQNIPGRDKELATLNGITFNYCSRLAESISYFNLITEISAFLKQMKIVPNESEDAMATTIQRPQLSREKDKINAPMNGANGHSSSSNGANLFSFIPSRSPSSDSTPFFATHKRTVSGGLGATSGGATGTKAESTTGAKLTAKPAPPIGAKSTAKNEPPAGASPAAINEPLTGEKTGAKSDQLIAAKPAAAKSPTGSHQ